jgi:hypothetical protein
MLVLVSTAVSTIVVAICCLIGTKIKSGVVVRALKQGLDDCPPAQRAKVLMAIAELADRIYGDRSAGGARHWVRTLIRRG